MRLRPSALLLLICGLVAARPALAQVSLTTPGTPYTQTFDTLATSGTANVWADNTTLPGWYSQFFLNAANPTTYRADSGGGNTGAIYSWGVAGVNLLTERAFGSVGSGTPGNIANAVRFVNNTGVTITSLAVAYTGEQWRAGGCTPTPCTPASQKLDFQYQIAAAGVITDANSPSTGWVDQDTLDFTSPTTGTSTAAALDGNAAVNRTALSATLTITIAAGEEVWIRWLDTNDANNDHGLAVDDVSVTPNPGGPATPSLSIDNVTAVETNGGTTTFTFTVGLSSPAGVGGVTFDIATADGTAQDDNPSSEDNDYAAKSLTGQTIAEGDSTYTFSVTVNGDTAVEPNETFFVNVTNVTAGATLGDGEGLGTITNDDVILVPIHDIQGPGASSPLVGNVVSTRGIVTGVKSNGFFIQEPDASVDADPATSEAVLVFTNAAPPGAAAVGNLVQVTGTVAEFVPGADLLQPPLTELTSPTVVLVSSGNTLPTPIPLTATFPDPAGSVQQLERVEAMRVSVASLTVVGPTLGNIDEANATATSTGVFYGVVTGVPRPFREPGIQADDPAPAGSIPPIPRFDSNPERIRVDSDGLVGRPLIDVGTGAVLTGLVGPLDYSFRTYTVLPDSPVSVSGGPTPTAVTDAKSTEFTVASFNVQRFFDTTNDAGISDVPLTTTAFNNRLAKASRSIRNFLKTPDIIGVVEMENLTTLQALATQINNDAVANSQPNPLYAPYLIEGNDIGGIDVGFLVKTAIVTGATPRVTVAGVFQELDGTLLVNPDSSTSILNDRPPLRLTGTVNHANGASFPVTVIVNHLRSLGDVASTSPGSNGWATDGDRVRAKRQKQAEDLANLVQARQVNDPTERIVLVGDFNAFEFNDGFVDSMNVIGGTPPPDNQTVVTGDGADLVDPDLVNLGSTPPPADQYSYVFDGNAQTLDHLIVNAPLISSTVARRIEHPRVNADFPEVAKNSTTDALRLSDHDPVVGYFEVAAFRTADLTVTLNDSADPLAAGNTLTYTIQVTNNGPDPAASVVLSGATHTGALSAAFVAPTAPWTCTTGPGTAYSCSVASLPVGTTTLTLTLVINPALTTGSTVSLTAAVTSTTADSNGLNNGDEEVTSVLDAQEPSLSLSKTSGTTSYSQAGDIISYTLTATNSGNVPLTGVVIVDPKLPSLTCAPAQPATLAPGASVTCQGNYIVTVGDLAAGFVSNTASASGQGLQSDVLPTPVLLFDIAQPEAVQVVVTAQATVIVPGIAPGVSGTRLALTACTLELQQDWQPRYTKLQFEVWNEDEIKFTGAFECADSWHETDFGASIDSASQNFRLDVLGTYSARYRVQAVTSTQCPSARATGLMGVQSTFFGPAAKATGTTTVGAGKFVGSIRWDPSGPVPEGGIRP